MPSVIVVGTQWGDEGKGKIVDILAGSARHVVRSQGGNNAGHTIVIHQKEYKLHLIPTGILHPETRCYIGAGCVIDPEVLVQEIDSLESMGIEVKKRLSISPHAHVILPHHRLLDRLQENASGEAKIGTTGRGIGPCYADKAKRVGLRMAELCDEEALPEALRRVIAEKNREISSLFNAPPLDFETVFTGLNKSGKLLSPYLAPVDRMLHDAEKRGEAILFEGAQGAMLDISFGSYPFVTSSGTLPASLIAGAGIGIPKEMLVLGVVKAYTTRVGSGPFPTEDKSAFPEAKTIREVGTTTGRERRTGWFDAVSVRQAIRQGGIETLAITKIDILDSFDEIKICIGYSLNGEQLTEVPVLEGDLSKAKPIYETLPGWKKTTVGVTTLEDLPEAARRYLTRLEQLLKVPFSYISTGPERSQVIDLSKAAKDKE